MRTNEGKVVSIEKYRRKDEDENNCKRLQMFGIKH